MFPEEPIAAALLGACAGPAPLLSPGAAVLCATSGGADSVALAAGLATLAGSGRAAGLRVVIGHVDHRLRPESAAEAAAVQKLTASLGLQGAVARLDPGELRALAAVDGLEAAARRLRYPALADLARAAGCSVVATAHTRRDQAETVLLRLARGGGLGALAGVRAAREEQGLLLVRPLLGVARADTEAYCRARGLAFTEDPHNRDPERARARLRASFDQLAGLLNPRLEEALAGAAAVAAREDDLLARLARGVLDGARAPLPAPLAGPGRGLAGGAFDPERLRAADPALLRRALHQAAREAGSRPERRHVESLCALVARGAGAADLPGRVRAAIRTGVLVFLSAPARTSAAPGPLAVPGPGRYAWNDFAVEVAAGPPQAEPGAAETIGIDAARAPFPWTVRAWRAGDRFRPAGGYAKKVGEQWIDAKIPREARARLPLIADASGALFWVAGLRPGDAGRPPHRSPIWLRVSSAAPASD